MSNKTSFSGASCTKEEMQPQQARASGSLTPQNLSESDKSLVQAFGLEEVDKQHIAENHKFHIDVVWEVAAYQPSLEYADQVLYCIHKAAEHN